MTDAFYRRRGNAFESTVHTTGPWDPQAQHGGPPTALLVRALEATASDLGQPHLARVTVELLRPVPVDRLRVAVETTKVGRSVSRLSARLVAGDREVMHATANVMRARPIDVQVAEAPAPPAHEDAVPMTFPFFRTEVGYHTAVDLRIARGTFGRTPTFVWLRSRIPLIEGEPLTPGSRVALAADSGNGVSPVVDWCTHSFINSDLTIAWHRPLDGEWVGLDASTDVSASRGVGLARTVICDPQGPVAAGLQSLLCDPIPSP